MNYREELPEGCPPPEAEALVDPQDVFRLAKSNPATLGDFRSQRAEKPNAVFNVSECQARGLSVFGEWRDAEEKARKLPALRGMFVCRVRLEEGAGRILQTSQPSHHTWWPLEEFDILAHCQMEIPL